MNTSEPSKELNTTKNNKCEKTIQYKFIPLINNHMSNEHISFILRN